MSDAPTPEQPDIESLSFEQAQAELEQIVERLEDQHTGLEEALALWERGEALHAYCQRKLDYAAARMEKLQVTQEEAAAAVAEPDAFVPEQAPAAGEPTRRVEPAAPAAAPASHEPVAPAVPMAPEPDGDPALRPMF